MTRIFLSYARGDDEPFVRQLNDDLTERGLEVWFDRVSMPSRQLSFYQEIADAIAARDRLLLVVGPRAVVSEYVTQEWRSALEMGKCVNPVVRLDGDQEGKRIDGYQLISEELKLLHAEDFRDDRRYSEHLDNLVRQLSEPAPPLGKLVAVPTLPPHYRAQPNRLRDLREALLIDLQRPVVVTGGAARFGVQGMPGIGKSVLAAALARDLEVRRAFPDGIFWVGIGQEPNLLHLQREFARALGEAALFDDLQSGRQRLRELLVERKALLVLDDVWRSADADAFDAAGPRCKLLLTTRDAGLVTSFAGTEYRVQLPSEAESLALVAAAARVSVERLPSAIHEVVRECGCLPLALALCGGMARKGHAWERILRALREARLELIADRHELSEQHRSIWRAMEVSVTFLAPEEQRRFAELAAFSQDADAPEAAALVLWEHTGGLDELAAADLLVSFQERSLIRLERPADAPGAASVRFSMHDLVRDFAARFAAQTFGGSAEVHQLLLDAYGRKCRDGWSTGPNDGYFFEKLGDQLLAAGRSEDLELLLQSLEFLEAKLGAIGPQALVDDYDLALQPPTSPSGSSEKPPEEDRESLWLLQGAFRLSAHVLAVDASQLRSQLLGRLLGCGNPAVEDLLSQARCWEGRTWFRPLRPTLTRPGGPLLRILAGHSGLVRSVAVTPDGLRAVSGSDDRTLRVWNLESGAVIATMEGHAGSILAVAITSDGLRVVSGSEDRTLRVWSLENGAMLAALEGHAGPILSVALTVDGCRAISGSWDGTLRVWDLEAGVSLATMEGHTRPVSSVVVTSDGLRAVSGSGDETLRVWDLESGAPREVLDQQGSWVRSVAVTPDGRHVLSASGDEVLRVWDLESGALLANLRGHVRPVSSVAVTQDGRCAVSGSDDRTLRVWDLESSALQATLRGHGGGVSSIAVTADGRRAVSGSEDRTLRVWDLRAGTPTAEGYGRHVTSVTVTPDGRRAVSGSWDGLRVWDLETGARLKELKPGWETISVAVTPNGRRAISGSWSGTLRIWDLDTFALLATLEGHSRAISSIAVTADGRRAVAGSDEGPLRVWDLETCDPLATLEGHLGSVLWLAVTPDDRRVVSGSDDGTVRIWDLATRVPLVALERHWDGERPVAATPDGRRVISCSEDKRLRVWDLETGALLETVDGYWDADSPLVVTPDGYRFVSGSSTGIMISDLCGGTIAAFMTDATITCLAATSDGSIIVAGDTVGKVHMLIFEEP